LKRLAWAALLATAGLVCGCGSNFYYPTPAITARFPQNITAGSQSFTLYLSGTNFEPETTAQWNGVNRPVFYNQSTDQLTMTILAGDVANAGSGQLTVANPGPGGGLNVNAVSFNVNPTQANGPVITSISPASGVVGSSADITLTVSGTNFVATDVITYNGTVLTTTYTGSQLTATLTSDNLGTEGVASVAVQTTTPNIASPSVQFPIGPSSNPAPHLSSVSPTSTAMGSLPPGGYLLLTGSGFVPGSVANFNGSPRPTGYSTSTQLAVGVLASDVATGGTVAVTVVNPNPGGGTSSSQNFTIQ
jgi:IPT/TIG domain